MEPTGLVPGIDAMRQPIVFVREGEVFANSRDVAAFFGKEHRHVLRDIDNLIQAEPDLARRQFSSEGGMPKFEQTPYTDPQNGQTYRCYEMTRDGFTLLAMGFTGSKALKWKLRYIEAFNAMEAELRRTARRAEDVLNDPAAMRGLLLTYTEKVLALEGQVSDLYPKAEALDRIATADGSLCITDAAKTLQVRPADLFKYLRSHGWIYKRTGSDHDVGYQSKLIAGTLEHKTTTVTRADGSEKVTTQVRVTPKGLAALAKVFGPAVRQVA